jgi:hypothetical protein
LGLTLGDVGQDKASADGAGGEDAVAIERYTLGIGNREVGRHGAVCADFHRLDRDRETRPDEAGLGRVQIISLVVAGERHLGGAKQRHRAEDHSGRQSNSTKHGGRNPHILYFSRLVNSEIKNSPVWLPNTEQMETACIRPIPRA